MKIINQDGERLQIKRAYYRKHYHEGQFMGRNVYGESNEGEVFLGTYDSKRAAKFTERTINASIDKGVTDYVLPGAGVVEDALRITTRAKALFKRLLYKEAVSCE